MKYGFILNSNGCTPDNYSGEISSNSFTAFVIGTENQDMAKEAAKYLVDEKKVDVLDLCGDFVDELRDDISVAIDSKVSVRSAKFYDDQAAKLDDIDWVPFGFIVKGEGLDYKKDVVELKVPACHLTMIGVDCFDDAIKAIDILVGKGVEFVELNRFFSEEETRKIINHVEGQGKLCAIGSAGIGEQG